MAAGAAGASNEAAVREPHRHLVKSRVFDTLTVVIPGLRTESLDERQELYADLGLDSLRFVQLLVELENTLSIRFDDEELMAVDLLTVADLIDLVARVSLPAPK